MECGGGVEPRPILEFRAFFTCASIVNENRKSLSVSPKSWSSKSETAEPGAMVMRMGDGEPGCCSS